MGESLGLKWSDIDLDVGTLRVNRQLQRIRESGGLVFSKPKNASRRTIDLPQKALEALRTHRKSQLGEKFKAGSYQDSALVFAMGKGTPLDAQNIVNRHFKPLLRRAGLPSIRWHDLRHTCATVLLGRGVHPKLVQHLLGHASITMTLDVDVRCRGRPSSRPPSGSCFYRFSSAPRRRATRRKTRVSL